MNSLNQKIKQSPIRINQILEDYKKLPNSFRQLHSKVLGGEN